MNSSMRLVLAASLLLGGCGEKVAPKVAAGVEDPATVSQSGDQGSLNTPDGLGGETDLSNAVSGSLIDAGYSLGVTSLLGIQVCEGEINLKFNPGFGADGKMFELPKAPISCLFGLKQFDLAEMMGSLGGAQPQDDGGGIEVDDNVIGLKGLGGSKYDPARPMFPSFLATPLDELKRLRVSRKIVMFTADGERSSGNATLRVTGFERKYRPPQFGETFHNVITFEVTHDGFNNISKLTNFIFDKMEMKVSLDPIAVTKVYLKGRVRDFTDALGGGAGGGDLFGDLLGGVTGGSGGGLGGIGTLAGELVKTADVEMTLDMIRLEGIEEMIADRDEADRRDDDDDER